MIFKDYSKSISDLNNTLSNIYYELNDKIKSTDSELTKLKNDLNAIKTNLEALKTSKNNDANKDYDNQILALTDKIANFERILTEQTITNNAISTYRLTKAQTVLLNFCTAPKTYKEIEAFMYSHDYSMGINFQKLKSLGLITKEQDKWIKTTNLSKTTTQ